MTVANVNSVGFCAHYSRQGDWAFEFALALARARSLRLNVFHFLSDPYDPLDKPADPACPEERERLLIDRERELRLYYDEKLGDFIDVGFRLCEDREWVELHRCLGRKEFQVLVLGRPDYGVNFAGKSLEEFADTFVCPVVLIGPSSETEYRLNSPARLIADTLGLPSKLRPSWRRTPSGLCVAS
jgi:hypothetical protein